MMMALHGSKRVLVICFLLILLSAYVTSSHQYTDQKTNETKGVDGNYNHHAKVFYKHTWPGMKFGWRIIVGTIIGFLGSSFGTVGGVGGGGIFVPMLTLVIGFDAKSATAISKFMITGGAGATVFYNLKKRHPSLDLPVIDYDLALLFQPMLMLGISLGVAFNVIFPDWMITTLLIIFFTGISVNAFLKGVNTWKKETLTKKEARENLQLSGFCYGKCLLEGTWTSFLCLDHDTCITDRKKLHNNLLGSILDIESTSVAGIIGGLLGLGGGFILGPLFIGLGIPPQVSSATSTFAMTFSASMSVVEYYLLKRFPISYALYFVAVATVAALIGQHLVRKLIAILGRASIIIFILALTVFVSGISLGGTGIANLIKRVENKEYMGFGNLCEYRVRN
uniref:Sulfite exporter TauE/SafE family protein 3-like isoform X3 n=1 Tax=Cicer arietinum TaxID=3827 RepID=A0A3Q7XD74_CICAR|nr:sulfite exporter TauE/SafE family protein 3-like isoform X3 [Cicer arietinum]